MDWRTRKTLQNLAILAVLAGAGWYGFKHIARGGDDGGRDECHARRAKIMEACNAECDEPGGKNLLAAHDQHRKGTRDQCIESCAKDKFGTKVPVCDSRR